MTDFQISEKIIDLNLLYNKLNHTNKENFKFYTNKENFKKYLFVDYNILWSSEDNVSLCFLGDEPYREILKQYAENCDFLMHEAFCLYEEREIFSPYEKHHSTVKECSENAEMLNAKNLIIIHTMDNDVANRKTYYCAEADYFCKCNVIMPDDMEVIELTHNDNE